MSYAASVSFCFLVSACPSEDAVIPAYIGCARLLSNKELQQVGAAAMYASLTRASTTSIMLTPLLQPRRTVISKTLRRSANQISNIRARRLSSCHSAYRRRAKSTGGGEHAHYEAHFCYCEANCAAPEHQPRIFHLFQYFQNRRRNANPTKIIGELHVMSIFLSIKLLTGGLTLPGTALRRSKDRSEIEIDRYAEDDRESRESRNVEARFYCRRLRIEGCDVAKQERDGSWKLVKRVVI